MQSLLVTLNRTFPISKNPPTATRIQMMNVCACTALLSASVQGNASASVASPRFFFVRSACKKKRACRQLAGGRLLSLLQQENSSGSPLKSLPVLRVLMPDPLNSALFSYERTAQTLQTFSRNNLRFREAQSLFSALRAGLSDPRRQHAEGEREAIEDAAR